MRLGDRLACPVVCDDDFNTILIGEMQFSAGRDCTLCDSIADTTGAASVGEEIKIPNCEMVNAGRERNVECLRSKGHSWQRI